MAKSLTALFIAASVLAIAACTTTQGYKICNDIDTNVTCPSNTANVVVK